METITINIKIVLQVLWALTFILFIISSGVITYHWISYSAKSGSVSRTLWTYYLGASFLLLISLVTILTL